MIGEAKHYATGRRATGTIGESVDRICLKCDCKFPSAQRFNRLCCSCKESNERISHAADQGSHESRKGGIKEGS